MFKRTTFGFLSELAVNNNREWFEANKARYEATVREPALEFIAAMAPQLEKFAPHFRADPRKMGGSLMRVFRDTRFSRDKTPYKTNVGIQFRHELAKDVHAPGFYMHIASDECFFGAGCWHPDPVSLGRIRDLIVENPKKWVASRDDKKLAAHWAFSGEALSRPPRGYPSNHSEIGDLKRKDFIILSDLSRKDVLGANLVKLASERFASAVPLMRFLCTAVGAQY